MVLILRNGARYCSKSPHLNGLEPFPKSAANFEFWPRLEQDLILRDHPTLIGSLWGEKKRQTQFN